MLDFQLLHMRDMREGSRLCGCSGEGGGGVLLRTATRMLCASGSPRGDAAFARHQGVQSCLPAQGAVGQVAGCAVLAVMCSIPLHPPP